MRLKNNKIKYKWNNFWGIVGIIVVTIILCVGLPIGINIVMSNDWVPSIGTTNSDWLSFWGSFLGGIFGGIATLIGIRLIVKSFFDDKKPIVVPMNKTFYLNIDYKQEKIEFYHIQRSIKESIQDKDIMFYICNVGRESALEVKVEWFPPKQINTRINGKEIEVPFDKMNRLIKCSRKETEFQLIRNTQGENTEGIALYSGFKEYINLLYKEYFKCGLGTLFPWNSLDDVDIGTVIITYKDIYGNSMGEKYKVNISGRNFRKVKYLPITMEFTDKKKLKL